ncbi:MAG: hypothetical protein FWG53_03360 [Clostridiales bacterium]|nr:hypothetical protein [Clostridiales bacterium]
MENIVGIDGGGSKTRFQLYGPTGRLLAETVAGTTDYHQIGTGSMIDTLREGLGELGAGLSGCLVGFGMPAYGENREKDERALFEIQKALPNVRMHVENDVSCAWAGALAFSPGVVVVCGTGSMSVGRGKSGALVRSGGWSEFFSDEGSGYWLGKKALEIFSKQSDCRLPKGALYQLMRQHLNLSDDIEINSIADSEYAGSRQKTASLQLVLLKARKLGDNAAAEAYTEAVTEVVNIVQGSVRQLDFGGGAIDVSYIGGLFDDKEFFLDSFVRELKKNIRANVHAPKLSPCHGAALFAVERFDKGRLDDIRQNFLRFSKE